MLNCVQALERLDEFVDGELNAADKVAVQEHLGACRPCQTHFEFETLFGEYVRRRTSRPELRPEFRGRLFARLHAEGQSLAVSERGRPFWIWKFALAASLVMLFTVAGMQMAPLGGAVVDWHRLAEYYEHPNGNPESRTVTTRDLSEARVFLAGQMGDPIGGLVPTRPPSGLRPSEAAILNWNTGPIGAVMLEGPHGDVSVYLGTIRCFPMTVEPMVERNGQEYRLATIDGMHAVCWEADDGLMCVMMAKSEFAQMLAWAESMRTQDRF